MDAGDCLEGQHLLSQELIPPSVLREPQQKDFYWPGCDRGAADVN